MHRYQIGLGEVAVVLRLLLGADRRRVLVRGVEMERLLLDDVPGLVHADLARDLPLDPLGGEVERVHVLQLGTRAELVATGGPHGDVHVEPHRALLELRIREPELDDCLPQELQKALRRVGVAPCSRPDSATWTFFAASSSRCARMIPTVISPSGVGTASVPLEQRGSSYWLIWYALGRSG